MERKPSCFDCIHGKLITGSPQTYWEPGEPDVVECEHPQLQDNWIETTEFIHLTEQELPEKCGRFEPILIEKCSCQACKKVMNVPQYNHKIWASTYDEPVPVCSEDCKAAVEVALRLEEEVGY